MAAGDINFYNQYLRGQEDAGAADSLSSMPANWAPAGDDIQVAILTDVFVPDTGDASTQKHWGDISVNQVATGASYTGPISLAAKTLGLSAGVVSFDSDDITVNQDATGFTNGRWLAFFKNSGVAGTSPLIAVGDLGVNKSIQAAPLLFSWNVNGIWQKS